jgi:hypothetical protein
MVFKAKVWIFGYWILCFFWVFIRFNFASHGATLVQSYYSCFKLHIEHSMLLSSCSLSLCICVNINYTFGHKKNEKFMELLKRTAVAVKTRSLKKDAR